MRQFILCLALFLVSVACNVTTTQETPANMPTQRNITNTPIVPTNTPVQSLELYPSSYFGCDELALHDAMFIEQISTDPTTLRYSGLRVISDGMLFMRCEGTAAFRGQAPHKRCIFAELFQTNTPNTLIQRRREHISLLYEHYLPIPGGLIAVKSGYC